MILVVDDKRENIFSLKRLLEINNYKIDAASSGEEALKKIRIHNYSLLLLDVQMPGMNGFEVAETISGYSKAKDLPIIFLSAVNLDKEFITRGYNSGGIDYITKPFDPDILLLKIKKFNKLSEQTRQLNNIRKHLQMEVQTAKQTEHELHNRNQELLHWIEAIPQIGFSGKPDGEIEYVNMLWYNYSTNKDQFPETYPGDLSIAEYWQKSREQHGRLEAEVRIKNLITEEYLYHLLIIVAVRKDDRIIKWVGTLTNINEQKAANKILEQRVKERTIELQEINRKLEISNEELEQFASVASHDLKDPLRRITTYSSFIKEKNLLGEGPGKDYIDRIIYSSKRMMQMIDNLFNYATLNTAELFKQSNLNAIVDEAIIGLESKIREKKAVFQIGVLPQVDIIPSQMREVFHNIIDNCLKFSKTDVPPIITISSEQVEEKSINSNASLTGNFCKITISDNGIGFDAQYAGKIFMIFQRLHLKSEYEGGGIGLAMVKRIINKHSGIIMAASEIDEGTKIIMVLPIKHYEALS